MFIGVFEMFAPFILPVLPTKRIHVPAPDGSPSGQATTGSTQLEVEMAQVDLTTLDDDDDLDLEHLTATDLRKELRSMGAVSSGQKRELVDRLRLLRSLRRRRGDVD